MIFFNCTRKWGWRCSNLLLVQLKIILLRKNNVFFRLALEILFWSTFMSSDWSIFWPVLTFLIEWRTCEISNRLILRKGDDLMNFLESGVCRFKEFFKKTWKMLLFKFSFVFSNVSGPKIPRELSNFSYKSYFGRILCFLYFIFQIVPRC